MYVVSPVVLLLHTARCFQTGQLPRGMLALVEGPLGLSRPAWAVVATEDAACQAKFDSCWTEWLHSPAASYEPRSAAIERCTARQTKCLQMECHGSYDACTGPYASTSTCGRRLCSCLDDVNDSEVENCAGPQPTYEGTSSARNATLKRNLIYIKIPKTASSTTAGVARRIAHVNGLSGWDTCGWIQREPGVWANHAPMAHLGSKIAALEMDSAIFTMYARSYCPLPTTPPPRVASALSPFAGGYAQAAGPSRALHVHVLSLPSMQVG